jgi:cytochrome P450
MTIPKGSNWALCIWALHRDPNIYPEPEKFIPERFVLIIVVFKANYFIFQV